MPGQRPEFAERRACALSAPEAAPKSESAGWPVAVIGRAFKSGGGAGDLGPAAAARQYNECARRIGCGRDHTQVEPQGWPIVECHRVAGTVRARHRVWPGQGLREIAPGQGRARGPIAQLCTGTAVFGTHQPQIDAIDGAPGSPLGQVDQDCFSRRAQGRGVFFTRIAWCVVRPVIGVRQGWALQLAGAAHDAGALIKTENRIAQQLQARPSNRVAAPAHRPFKGAAINDAHTALGQDFDFLVFRQAHDLSTLQDIANAERLRRTAHHDKALGLFVGGPGGRCRAVLQGKSALCRCHGHRHRQGHRRAAGHEQRAECARQRL